MRWKRLRWVLLGLVVLACGLGGTWALRVARTFTAKGGSLTSVWNGIANPRSLFPGQNRVVILVLGRDYDRDRKGMPHSKHSRADTIILLSVDLENKSLSAVSIPRDTRVEAPDGYVGKINGVLTRPDGIDLMRRTIAAEFGVWPDYYVLLKPAAVRSIVDELGGVQLESLDVMKYDDSWGQLHIDLPKGRFQADGAQAEGYVRFRQPSKPGKNLEEGDLRRTARQQNLIRAMIATAFTPKNLVRADKVIETGFEQIDTDLGRSQVLALATLFKETGSAGMRSATVPGEDVKLDEIYYYILDKPRAMKLVDWLVNGNYFAGRATARVSVYNASKVNGVARAIASALYSEGFEAWNGGTARDKVEQTEVVFRRSLYEGYAREIADMLGSRKVRKDPGDPRVTWGPDIFVYIGPDRAEALDSRYGATASIRP